MLRIFLSNRYFWSCGVHKLIYYLFPCNWIKHIMNSVELSIFKILLRSSNSLLSVTLTSNNTFQNSIELSIFIDCCLSFLLLAVARSAPLDAGQSRSPEGAVGQQLSAASAAAASTHTHEHRFQDDEDERQSRLPHHVPRGLLQRWVEYIICNTCGIYYISYR